MQKRKFLAVFMLFVAMVSGCNTTAVLPDPAPSAEVLAIRGAMSEDAAWSLARASKDAEVLSAFLDRFPEGSYHQSAQLRLKLIQRGAIK